MPDRDGTVRFTPLVVEYGKQYYPSLALEDARAYLNFPLPPIIHALQVENRANITKLEFGDRFLPCDERGKLLINYYGPAHTFQHYSLSDVIQGHVPAYKFADKIVLLGVTSNIVQDLHAVPFQTGGTYPGVEINATIIDNILRNDFLIRPEWTTLVEAVIIFGLGLMLGIVRHRKSPIWAVWAALLCLLLVSGLAHAAFLIAKVWLNVTYAFLCIVVDYLTITSYKYFTEERQKRNIKKAFQYYLSPQVADHMLKSIHTLKLGGERKYLTAFFSDIRGFTPISEAARESFKKRALSSQEECVLVRNLCPMNSLFA